MRPVRPLLRPVRPHGFLKKLLCPKPLSWVSPETQETVDFLGNPLVWHDATVFSGFRKTAENRLRTEQFLEDLEAASSVVTRDLIIKSRETTLFLADREQTSQ